MIKKLKAITRLAPAVAACKTEPDTDKAAAFEASFESLRRRWQSFLDLYIRNDASLEINLTAELRLAALSLEFNPSQCDSITNILNRLLGEVFLNIRDTYSRFKRAFVAGAFIEHSKVINK